MAMSGMCVGLGAVWRFPYLVGEYGGGTFLLAFLVCTAICVVPLAFVETALGKGIGAVAFVYVYGVRKIRTKYMNPSSCVQPVGRRAGATVSGD